jgi:riboflavin kinase/FMN adenylyltransferase
VPTANLEVWEKLLLPVNGVYAAYAWLDDGRYKAATNIGYRPTVNGHTLNVEAHLLDFEGDLYGRELELEIVARIRDERKFPDLQALVAQIKADIIQVSTLLAT